MTDLGIDAKGRGMGKLIDRLDYKYRDVKDYKDVKNIINNHGYNMQEKGNFPNYYNWIDILSDEEKHHIIMEIFDKLIK